MATKKTVKAESEEPNEENQEVLDTKEVKEANQEEKELEIPNIEPIVRDELILRDEEVQNEDPKTFDDVYKLLEQIDGKIDIIIRGL